MRRLDINDAVTALREGKLVVLPTETVYGLASDGLNEKAIEKLFLVKGRPKNNPIMLQVADIEMLKLIVKEIPMTAKKLIEAFWPGPLTLVLKKRPEICSILSAGTENIGVRMPDQPLTLEIIRIFNRPLAVPSANISGKIAPKTPKEVEMQLDGQNIEGLVDAGECKIGMASTVIDLTTDRWHILRDGPISKEQISAILD